MLISKSLIWTLRSDHKFAFLKFVINRITVSKSVKTQKLLAILCSGWSENVVDEKSTLDEYKLKK